MKKICERDRCTGCYACVNVCPSKCIEMKANECGYLYPEIFYDKCITCGLCQQTCPAVKKLESELPKHVYAAINKEKYDYETSTSGGIATLFTRKILAERGIVYGAAILENLEVKHIRVECEKDAERIKGSKYVQSSIGDSFAKIKKDLDIGKKVLFVGTPCQVAGLRKYLKREYENLYTCDIVCHGTPPLKMLKDHLRSIISLEKIESISFRDKEGYYLSLYGKKQQLLYRKKNFYDIYYIGFLRGLYLRKSCFSCQYANSKRVGDITLGDFWGFDKEKGMFPVEAKNGLSLVMVNTKKGQMLFEKCKTNMLFIEREIAEAVEGNKQLRHPVKQHRKYERFQKNYMKFGFKRAAKRALWIERIAYALIDRR